MNAWRNPAGKLPVDDLFQNAVRSGLADKGLSGSPQSPNGVDGVTAIVRVENARNVTPDRR